MWNLTHLQRPTSSVINLCSSLLETVARSPPSISQAFLAPSHVSSFAMRRKHQAPSSTSKRLHNTSHSEDEGGRSFVNIPVTKFRNAYDGCYQNKFPYRTIFRRTKFLADEIFRRTKFPADKNFRQTKFSAASQIFGTFVHRNFVR